MTIPHLPTDNLYKFLALSGLTLFIVGLLVTVKVYEAQESYLDTQTILKMKIDVYQAEFERLATGAEVLGNTDLGAEYLRQAQGAIEKQQSQYLELLEHRANNNPLKYSARIRLSCAAMLSGFLLSVLGFSLWYWRVQRFLDLKALQDATEPSRGIGETKINAQEN